MSNKITPFAIFKRSNSNYTVESTVANILKTIKKKQKDLEIAQKKHMDLEVAQKKRVNIYHATR